MPVWFGMWKSPLNPGCGCGRKRVRGPHCRNRMVSQTARDLSQSTDGGDLLELMIGQEDDTESTHHGVPKSLPPTTNHGHENCRRCTMPHRRAHGSRAGHKYARQPSQAACRGRKGQPVNESVRPHMQTTSSGWHHANECANPAGLGQAHSQNAEDNHHRKAEYEKKRFQSKVMSRPPVAC